MSTRFDADSTGSQFRPSVEAALWPSAQLVCRTAVNTHPIVEIQEGGYFYSKANPSMGNRFVFAQLGTTKTEQIASLVLDPQADWLVLIAKQPMLISLDDTPVRNEVVSRAYPIRGLLPDNEGNARSIVLDQSWGMRFDPLPPRAHSNCAMDCFRRVVQFVLPERRPPTVIIPEAFATSDLSTLSSFDSLSEGFEPLRLLKATFTFPQQTIEGVLAFDILMLTEKGEEDPNFKVSFQHEYEVGGSTRIVVSQPGSDLVITEASAMIRQRCGTKAEPPKELVLREVESPAVSSRRPVKEFRVSILEKNRGQLSVHFDLTALATDEAASAAFSQFTEDADGKQKTE